MSNSIDVTYGSNKVKVGSFHLEYGVSKVNTTTQTTVTVHIQAVCTVLSSISTSKNFPFKYTVTGDISASGVARTGAMSPGTASKTCEIATVSKTFNRNASPQIKDIFITLEISHATDSDYHNNGQSADGTDILIPALPSYTLTVNSGGNGTVSGGGTYQYGTSVTISATPNAHYHFVKWSDNNTSASRTVTVTGAATYTATFAIDTHTITVKSGGNGTVSGGGTYNYGSQITIKATPSTGYNFVQWSDGNTSASRTITVTGNATYTATFTVINYTISYTLNGGSVSGNPTSYNVTTATFTLKNPTKPGYSFSGWTGSGSGLTITIPKGSTGNKSYVANWTINPYILTADANGGTIGATSGWTIASGGSYATKSVNYAASYGTLPTPTKVGYTFTGWYTAKTGGSAVSSQTTMGTSNTTIYAHWEAQTSTVPLHKNGGSGGTDSVTATYDSAMPTNNVTMPARTGYTFQGYYDTSANSGGTQYYTATGTSAHIWDKTGNVTLYARWSINSYTLTVLANGGIFTNRTDTSWTYSSNNTIATKKFQYGTTISFPADPTRSNYIFSGWSNNPIPMPADDLEASAQWTPVDAYVRFDRNDLDGVTLPFDLHAPFTQNIRLTQANGTPSVIPEGYTFIGWCSDPIDAKNGDESKIIPWDSVVHEAGNTDLEKTLYAAIKAKVIFTVGETYPSGVVPSDIIKSGYFNQQILAPEINDYIIPGHRLTYWSTNPAGTLPQTPYIPGSVVKPNGTYNHPPYLYAQGWQDYNTPYAEFDSETGVLRFFVDQEGEYENGEVIGTKTYYTGIEDTHGNQPWSTKANLITMVQFDSTMHPQTMANWFYNCTNLTEITSKDGVNTLFDTVTNMSDCFNGCSALIEAPTIPSSVTNMSSCFLGCFSLKEAPEIPNGVIYMGYCFDGCSSLTTAPTIPSGVTNVGYCFRNCSSLTTAPTIPSSVTNMSSCFQNCSSLILAPTIPSSVTTMHYCFYNCTSLTTAPIIPSSVTSMTCCFQNCSSLKGNIVVNNTPTGYSNIFANTSQDIFIVRGGDYAQGEDATTVATKWRTIAANYSNVHFEGDDNPKPSVGNIDLKRGTVDGQRIDYSEDDGTVVKITLESATVTTEADQRKVLPENWTNKLVQLQTYIDDTSIDIRSSEPLLPYIFEYNTNDINRHIIKIVVTDSVGNQGIRTVVLTIPSATIDFKAGGEGVSIGTFAKQNGFTVQMPTRIGQGLAFYTPAVIRSIDIVEYQENEPHWIPHEVADTESITVDYNSYDNPSSPLSITYVKDQMGGQGTRCFLNPPGYTGSNCTVSSSISHDLDSVEEIINPQVGDIAYTKTITTDWVDVSKPQLIVGRYNIPVEDALFIIGNGTGSELGNRSNALVVTKDGEVYAY